MTDPLLGFVQNALSGMSRRPGPLLDAIRFYAEQEDSPDVATAGNLIQHIKRGANDPVRKALHGALSRWDWEESASWGAGTAANSGDRRKRIYDLLRIEPDLRDTFDKYIPAYQPAKAAFVDDPKAVRDWYTSDFRSEHKFYWEKLRAFLRTVRELDEETVNSIESSANRILDRLADPGSAEVLAARGLVVGYVQSGKTTNFTAVIAKAIDAGYRLIIILSGTTNLLRNQTQRRLDMDLAGRENIQKGAKDEEAAHDYVEDEGWPARFISYGGRPSLLGNVDIHRLTTQEDFATKEGGFNPLEFNFEKRERTRPLFERENLDHAGARLAVVKKQGDRLRALIGELKAVGPEMCAEVPTLVIDDESDQASINTVDPKKVRENKERTAINDCIVEILNRLPRAQYLGYTATPFANVFVSPRDPRDLYPRHFIVSLDRPQGYMGAREFVDFEVAEPGRLSNREAYIREVPVRRKGSKEDDFRLQEAMDAFLLTGAIKKFRLSRGARDDQFFKHHTMLYHQSVRTKDQEATKQGLGELWKSAGYDSPGPALNRLNYLLESDFRKVWMDRGRQFAFPDDFDQLLPFLGEALDAIRKNGDTVLMVNSAEGADVPDFDGRTGVWKIILGGAKLSRGYTIQGLTVSYFRRQSKMQDTLMQMGRWFGYRPGYADLVRLYIGVAERVGAGTVNLYEAFKAMCRDEEDFRAQLAMYAGKDGITPLEVPALVFNSYPSLRPTSRNKMFHAEITWAAFDYREPTGQKKGSAQNAKAFLRLLEKADIKTDTVKSSREFDIKWARLRKNDVSRALGSLEWEKSGDRIEAEIRYLGKKDLHIDSWIIVAPQIGETENQWVAHAEEFNCIARARIGARFGVFSSPEHVQFAKWLVDPGNDSCSSRLKQSKTIGVLLFYPTWEKVGSEVQAKGTPTMGFALVLPQSARADTKRIAWKVKSS